jgi:sugar transferase (PEP-CTERM/EpsH1 system associated)
MSLIRGGLHLIRGGCLNAGYFYSRGIKQYVERLAQRVDFGVALIYAAVMMPYAPSHVPVLLDMQDVDSEKWFSYAESRRPGFLYRLEANRLRKFEAQSAKAAACTVLTTHNEESVLRSFVSGVRTTYMENGVDFDYFDGKPLALPLAFAGREFIVFIGNMNYYPNVDGVAWFAREIFPELRQLHPCLEFLIVGNRPGKQVQRLGAIEGVTVAGKVADIRPFLAGARALVVPLRIARGIQNKVLEGLAMGRRVFVTDAVTRTFGPDLPKGVIPCETGNDFVRELLLEMGQAPHFDPAIRNAARNRFSWDRNVESMVRELEVLVAAKRAKSSHVRERNGAYL